MKKLLSMLLAAASLVSCFATTSFASVPENNTEAVEVSAEAFDEANAQEIGCVAVVVDEDGNAHQINPYLYDNSHDYTGSGYTAYFTFSKSGSTYQVAMSGTGRKGEKFTSHVMKIKPKNNTNWLTHSYPHETEPSSISDSIYFSYPSGAPSNVNVQVSFKANTTNVMQIIATKFTLDRP